MLPACEASEAQVWDSESLTANGSGEKIDWYLDACLHQRSQIWDVLLLKAAHMHFPCKGGL